jgi:hypothetical protein
MGKLYAQPVKNQASNFMIVIKEQKMGHKGVSKRKPKKDKSSVVVGTSSEVRIGDIPSVQLLVKDKDSSLNRGGANQHTGSNKKGKKDKR